MIERKNVNIAVIFFLVFCFVETRRFQWKVRCFRRISIQDQNTVCELIKSLLCLGPLIYARIYLLNGSDFEASYSKLMCPLFCRDPKLVDSEAIQSFNYTLALDCVAFLGLFWLKRKDPKINTLTMLVKMTRFTCLFFGLYCLYTGQLTSTLKYVQFAPEIMLPLFKVYLIRFLVYLVFAYAIVTYSSLTFFSIFLSRGLFQDFYQNLSQTDDSKDKKPLYFALGIVVILMIELIVKIPDIQKTSF